MTAVCEVAPRTAPAPQDATPTTLLPLPPMELRALVGPRDDEDFDNPTGAPIYPHLPESAYRFVFDFGCGCGRLARRLIQQRPRPKRYVGIDPHRGMIDWANRHLAPAAPGFEFHHHDVYSPGYAPTNRLRLADHFPADDGCVSLFIAHSVFTHLTLDQTLFYLSELARVLAPDGVAFTSWFFFDNASLPFWSEGPYALYADEKHFSAAVIYDRHWFIEAVRQQGLAVRETKPPQVPGHQWEVWLARRQPGDQDRFPLGPEGAEYVCGATWKPLPVTVPDDPGVIASIKTGSRRGQIPPPQTVRSGGVPPLFEPLAELARLREEIEIHRSARTPLWRRVLDRLRRQLTFSRV
ncbi:MAG: class I SAM-dependent methyltransferase [Gemmataceae bacterium]|nr:class I SAM-dependent methyltransferase [Gemmataceae bacterium]MDW8265174.1 class I SAM-dependent methyltransferase [Gemmataceae bacterium]